jgi:hypothetical protein
MAGDTSSVRLAPSSQIVPPRCSYRESPAPASRISPGIGYRLPFCLPWFWKSGDDANLSRLGKPHHRRELAQLKPTRHREVKKPSTRGSVPRHCKKEENWLNRLSSSRAVTIRAPWRYDLRRRGKAHGGRVTCHPTGQALLLLGAGEICGKRIKAERVHAVQPLEQVAFRRNRGVSRDEACHLAGTVSVVSQGL